MNEVVNIVALVMALTLFLTTAALVRPANGTRPLLIGFMWSSLFGLYIACVRVFALQELSRPIFGFVFCFWLFTKLWAIYSVALHTPRPFLYLVQTGLRRLFGHNPHLD